MPLVAIPFFVWLVASLGTLLPGYVIVRFLPVWASIPLMVILAAAMTMAGVFMIVAAVPGESKKIKQVDRLFSLMLCLTLFTPGWLALKLYAWVG